MSALATASATCTHISPDGRAFSIRPAAGLEDLDQCIALQQETWGYSDLEVVPRNIYVLAQALGGHVLCAWDEQARFAGFAMAIAAHQPPPGSAAEQVWMRSRTNAPETGQSRMTGVSSPGPAPTPYLHSHLVAIVPAYRSCGLGKALKFAQRDHALAAGLGIMRWTFDPLMARNAAFNLNRLGATVQRYIPDFYGRLSSSLQGGAPTDRFLAEWTLEGPRIEAARTGRLTPPDSVEHITLTSEIATWKAEGRVDRLERVQHELHARCAKAFARGLCIQGFALDGAGGGAYLLAPAPSG